MKGASPHSGKPPPRARGLDTRAEAAVQRDVTRLLAHLGWHVTDTSQPRASKVTAGLPEKSSAQGPGAPMFRILKERAVPVFVPPGAALTDHPEPNRAMATSKLGASTPADEMAAREARGRYSNEEILEELRRVAALTDAPLSSNRFRAARPRISASAVTTRFGGWLAAIKAAGLDPAYKFGGIWFDCPICGTRFRSDNGEKSRRTCSRECTREAMRRNKPNRKGRLSTPQAARGRARSRVDLVSCRSCGHDGSVNQLEVHHRDGDPYNNDRANLEVLCSKCHGREHRRGYTPRHSIRRFTADQVREVRGRADQGESYGSLGRAYGVSTCSISALVNRKTYQDVT